MDNVTGPDPYTAEQRETLESGLRILARMIARAQLSKEGPQDSPNGEESIAPADGNDSG